MDKPQDRTGFVISHDQGVDGFVIVQESGKRVLNLVFGKLCPSVDGCLVFSPERRPWGEVGFLDVVNRHGVVTLVRGCGVCLGKMWRGHAELGVETTMC